MSGAGRQTGASPQACDERALIARILAGERDLFHDLIRPYKRGMYNIAYAVLRNPGDAEEVTQEAAFKGFLHLGELKNEERFKSWVLRITVNEARMRRRKERAHLYEGLEADEPEDESGHVRVKQFADWHDLPCDALDRRERREAVRKAVAQLPEKYRVVFLMADNQRMSSQEIAVALDLSISNVKTRLHRARLKLQEQLEPVFKPRMFDHVRLMKGMNPWSRVRK